MGMKNEQLTYYKINNYIDPFVTHNPQKSDVRFGSEVFVTETIFKPTIQRSTSYYSL